MAFPTEMNFSGAFSLDTKQINITDLTNYTGQGTGWVGYYSINAPNGSNIYTGVASPPDTTQASPTVLTRNLAVDASGNPITGVYSITMTIYNPFSLQSHTKTKTVAFEITKPTAILDFVGNQFESTVTVTDNTNYVQVGITPTTITELITLTYPTGLTYDPYVGYPTPITSSTSSLGVVYNSSTQNGLFANGKYLYALASTATYDLGNDFTASVSITALNSITPIATFNLNPIYSCLRALKIRLDKAIKTNDVLADEYNYQYTGAIQLVEMIRESYSCNKLTDCESYINDFYSLTGCTNNDGIVQLVIPILFSQNIEVVSGSSPSLTVTKSTQKNTETGVFYDQYLLDLNIGTESVYQKLIYLDPNGDDTTGVVGSPLFPYSTFAKVNSFGPGNTIIINPGVYTENLPYNQNNVYIDFGSTIICTNGFDMRYSPKIKGYGNISCTDLIIDNGTTQNTEAKIEADSLVCSSSILGTINTSTVSDVVIKIKRITTKYISKNKILQNATTSKITLVDGYLSMPNGSGAVSLLNLNSNATTPVVSFERMQIDIRDAVSGLYSVGSTFTSWVSSNKTIFVSANSPYLCLSFAGTLNIVYDQSSTANIDTGSSTIYIYGGDTFRTSYAYMLLNR